MLLGAPRRAPLSFWIPNKFVKVSTMLNKEVRETDHVTACIFLTITWHLSGPFEASHIQSLIQIGWWIWTDDAKYGNFAHCVSLKLSYLWFRLASRHKTFLRTVLFCICPRRNRDWRWRLRERGQSNLEACVGLSGGQVDYNRSNRRGNVSRMSVTSVMLKLPGYDDRTIS